MRLGLCAAVARLAMSGVGSLVAAPGQAAGGSWWLSDGRRSSTNRLCIFAFGRVVAVLFVPLVLLGSAWASSATGAAALSSSATQLIAVDLRSGGCTTSTLSASTAPIEFVIANHTRRVAAFTLAGRPVSLGGHRSARLRVRLPSGRYPYSCTPHGRGSLLVVAAAEEHRIVVVTGIDGRQHLADRLTGAPFVPRGATYTRLGPESDGQQPTYHTTFSVGDYDAARADRQLARMHRDGYNTVRVFLNGTCSTICLGQPGGTLRARYIANLIDFLRRATANQMYVIVTMDYLPWVGHYNDLVPHVVSEYPTWQNIEVLSPIGVQANADFFRELAQRLLDGGAPIDALVAYELRSELVLNWNEPPLSLSSGVFTGVDGRSYDLSSYAEKQALVANGTATFIDHTRDAIRTADPSALVTIGFPVVGAQPFDEARAAIDLSSADFVDVHYYPNQFVPEATFAEAMTSDGVTGQQQKPIILGEFGAFKHAYSTATEAAAALVALQQQSCSYGIAGWLLWTWDTIEDQPDLWTAIDANGLLERALSPAQRPDPCAPRGNRVDRLAPRATGRQQAAVSPVPPALVAHTRDETLQDRESSFQISGSPRSTPTTASSSSGDTEPPAARKRS
jgi:Cellulase (glycosyl hydrolase family 5)